ncbi:MAG TPA: phosphoribosyltransferase family protein [Microlunatus sp.]|nr:phosphoribosyltransferase family protein [Microlunatus sp.]
MGERAIGWWSAAADLLLGAGCPGCGAPWWGACPSCRAHVLAQPTRLTAPVPAPRGFPLTATAGVYDDVHRGLITAHKEEQAFALTALLGDRLAAAVEELLAVRGARPDEQVLLVPVPSAARTVRERGFDSTGALARRAVRRLSATRPVTTARVLAQHRGLADQSGLDAAQRAANLHGGLRLRRRIGDGLTGPDGAPVVVVDDLVTTGASLTEAVRCLDSGGYEVLGAATVSATVRRVSAY